jgi:hypothetical protein
MGAMFCLTQYMGSSAATIFRERCAVPRGQRAGAASLLALAWQHLDAVRNVEASAAAILRGDPERCGRCSDSLVKDGT